MTDIELVAFSRLLELVASTVDDKDEHKKARDRFDDFVIEVATHLQSRTQLTKRTQ